MTSRLSRIAPYALTITLAVVARSSADDLPKGQEVLDQFVEATGGKAAYEKVKTRSVKGTMEFVGAGVKGTIETQQSAPNLMVATLDIPNVVNSKSGFDGKTVWEVNSIQGERLIEGEERADKLDEAELTPEINTKERYKTVECVALEDVDGKPAYKLAITPKVGKPFTEFYDKESHLLVKSIKNQVSPQGEIVVEEYPSDYKKVDGIMIAMKAKVKLAQQELLFSISEIKQNVEIPATAYTLPDEIKKLVDKK